MVTLTATTPRALTGVSARKAILETASPAEVSMLHCFLIMRV